MRPSIEITLLPKNSDRDPKYLWDGDRKALAYMLMFHFPSEPEDFMLKSGNKILHCKLNDAGDGPELYLSEGRVEVWSGTSLEEGLDLFMMLSLMQPN